MSFNNGLENSYAPDRSPNKDVALRVAQEMYQHNLSGAASDIRNFFQNKPAMPDKNVRQFVSTVDDDLIKIGAEASHNGLGNQNYYSNCLEIQPIWTKGGQAERIWMCNEEGDYKIGGDYSKKIADVPVCARPYQFDERPAPGYYGQTPPYNSAVNAYNSSNPYNSYNSYNPYCPSYPPLAQGYGSQGAQPGTVGYYGYNYGRDSHPRNTLSCVIDKALADAIRHIRW